LNTTSGKFAATAAQDTF